MILIDTDVMSNLHKAGELARMIRVFGGTLRVAHEVVVELEEWPQHGVAVRAILDHAFEAGLLVETHLERQELGLYSQLRERLGRGEAASISVAAKRRHAVATDDRAAQRLCNRHNPRVHFYMTEDLMELAVKLGQLPREDALRIWQRIGIDDLTRGVK